MRPSCKRPIVIDPDTIGVGRICGKVTNRYIDTDDYKHRPGFACLWGCFKGEPVHGQNLREIATAVYSKVIPMKRIIRAAITW